VTANIMKEERLQLRLWREKPHTEWNGKGNQWLYLLCARTVHMQSQSVIYCVQIAHAYRRRISEELRSRFSVNIAVIT